MPDPQLTAVICTVDLLKRDVELKLLLGCSADEERIILDVHNAYSQSGMLVERPRGRAMKDA